MNGGHGAPTAADYDAQTASERAKELERRFNALVDIVIDLNAQPEGCHWSRRAIALEQLKY